MYVGLTAKRINFCENNFSESGRLMMKAANFNMTLNPAKKTRLESMYGRMGLTLPEAVNVFFEESLLADGFPFVIQQPGYNEETEAAIQEARDIMSGEKHVKGYRTARELFDELDGEEC